MSQQINSSILGLSGQPLQMDDNTRLEPKRRSLQDVVMELMRPTRSGSEMKQALVLSAIQSFTNQIVAAGRPAAPGNGIINGQLWFDLSKEIKDDIELMMKQNLELEVEMQVQV